MRHPMRSSRRTASSKRRPAGTCERTEMNVLITSVGRANRLVRDFRHALGDDGLVLAADASTAAPALCEAHRVVLVPVCTDPSYIDRLVRVCAGNDVGLLVP